MLIKVFFTITRYTKVRKKRRFKFMFILINGIGEDYEYNIKI